MEIGEVIGLLIKKRGLTQAEAAEKIGKSRTALSQIIVGNSKPQSETLEKLSKLLGVPVPIIHFLCVEEKDIPVTNLPLYKALGPTIEKYLIDVFDVTKEDLSV